MPEAVAPAAPPSYVLGGPQAPIVLPAEAAEVERPWWGDTGPPPLGFEIMETTPWEPPEWVPEWLQPAARSLRYHIRGGMERVEQAWERPETRAFLPSGVYTEEEADEERGYAIPTYPEQLSQAEIQQLAIQYDKPFITRMDRETLNRMWPTLWIAEDPRIGARRWEDVTRESRAARAVEQISAVTIQAGLQEPAEIVEYGLGALGISAQAEQAGIELTPEEIGALSQRTWSLFRREVENELAGKPSAVNNFMREIARGEIKAEDLAQRETDIVAELVGQFLLDPLNHADIVTDVLGWGPKALRKQRLTKVEQTVARQVEESPRAMKAMREWEAIMDAGAAQEVDAIRGGAASVGETAPKGFWDRLKRLLGKPAELTPGALVDRDVSEVWIVGGGPIAEMTDPAEAITFLRQMAADPAALAPRYGRTVTSQSGQKMGYIFGLIADQALQFPSIKGVPPGAFDPLAFILDLETAAMDVLKTRHGFTEPDAYLKFANAWKGLMSEFYLTAFFSPGYALARNPATDLFTMGSMGLLSFEHVNDIEAFEHALAAGITTRRVTTKGRGAKTALTGIIEGESRLPGPFGWLSKKGQEIARHGEALGRMPFGEEPRYRRGWYKAAKRFWDWNAVDSTPPLPTDVTAFFGPDADDLITAVGSVPGMPAKRAAVKAFLEQQAPGTSIAWQKYLTPRDLDSLSPELSRFISEELAKLPAETTDIERAEVFNRLKEAVDDEAVKRLKDIEQLPGRKVATDVEEAEVTEPIIQQLEDAAERSGDPRLVEQVEVERARIEEAEQEIFVERGLTLDVAKEVRSTFAMEILALANRDVEDLRYGSRERLWELLSEIQALPQTERAARWSEYFTNAAADWHYFAAQRVRRYQLARDQLQQLADGVHIDEILGDTLWERALDRLIAASEIPPPPEGLEPGLKYVPAAVGYDPVEHAKFEQFLTHRRGTLDSLRARAWREALLSDAEGYSDILDYLDSASRREELYGKIAAAEVTSLRNETMAKTDALVAQGKYAAAKREWGKFYGKRNDLWGDFFSKADNEWQMVERDVIMRQFEDRMPQPSKITPRDRKVPHDQYVQETGQSPARKADPAEKGERATDALPGDGETLSGAIKKTQFDDWTPEERAALDRWLGERPRAPSAEDVVPEPLPESPPGVFQRADWAQALRDRWNLPDEMIDAQLAFMDARANQYAKHFGTTPDEWWSRWIAGVQKGEDEALDLLQFQVSEKGRRWIDEAISFFGTTEDRLRGGFLLPDGQLLDFGPSEYATGFPTFTEGRRASTHSDIGFAIDELRLVEGQFVEAPRAGVTNYEVFMDETRAARISEMPHQVPGTQANTYVELRGPISSSQMRYMQNALDEGLAVHLFVRGPDGKWISQQFLRDRIGLARARSRINQAWAPEILGQGYKGGIEFMPDGKAMFYSFEGADLSTVIHEPAHLFLNEIVTYAGEGDAFYAGELAIIADWTKIGAAEDFSRLAPIFTEYRRLQAYGDTRTAAQTVRMKDIKADALRYEKGHEQFAEGAEVYMRTGEAPTPELAAIFERIKQWLLEIYQGLKGEDVQISDEVKGVFDRLLAEQPIPRTDFPSRTAGSRVKGWADPASKYDFEYVIADLDDLTASHLRKGQQFAPNPDYPTVLQPRSRDRADYAAQVNRMAAELDADELLSMGNALDTGPIIVGPDGVIESGNGRYLAIRQAQRTHPDKHAAYVEQLRQRYINYGLQPNQFETIDNPVLVRRRLSDVDREAFAVEANLSKSTRFSAAEQAAADVSHISDGMLSALTVGDNQTVDQALKSAANRDIRRVFLDALSKAERNELVDAKGNLARRGLDRIKNALLAKTYPGDAGRRLLEAMTESTAPVVKNAENAIYQSLGHMARMEGAIRLGQRGDEFSIADDVAISVDMLSRIRADGIKVEDYLRQQGMFGADLDPLQRELLAYMGENARAPKALRELLRNYTQRVIDLPAPAQVTMPGIPPPPTLTKGELLDLAMIDTYPEAATRFQAAAQAPGAVLFQRGDNWLPTARYHYGVTTDTREAGFLQPDGKMLSFAKEYKGARVIAHDTVRDVTGAATVDEFLRRTGAARISDYGPIYAEFHSPPSPAQMKWMNEQVKGDKTLLVYVFDAEGQQVYQGFIRNPVDLRMMRNVVEPQPGMVVTAAAEGPPVEEARDAARQIQLALFQKKKGEQLGMFDELETTPLGSGTAQRAARPRFAPAPAEPRQLEMPGMELRAEEVRQADRARRLKPRIVDFRGERVRLTGETEVLEGGTFWPGVYESGSKMGQKVDVADEIVQRQTAAARAGQARMFQEDAARAGFNRAFAQPGATMGPDPQIAVEAGAKATKRSLDKIQQGLDQDWTTWQPNVADQQVKGSVQRWLDEDVEPAWWEFLATTKGYAKTEADEALFNYRNRRNFDMWLHYAFPYHFWFTRSAWNWSKRILGRPAFLSQYIRVRDALKLANRNAGRRQRFEGKIPVPFPWLPDFMGETLYIDPFRMVLPYANVGGQTWDDPDERRRGLRAVWAGIETAGFRPYHFLEIPYKAGWLAKAGELVGMEPGMAQEVLAPEARDMSFFLPQTNLIRGLTAGRPWAPPMGINIEAPIRRALGLPAGEVYDPYRVGRMLGNISADDPTDRALSIATLDAQELMRRDEEQTERVWSEDSGLAQAIAEEYGWAPERLAEAQRVLSLAMTRAAQERLVSGIGWLTGPTLAVEPTGERAQLEMAERGRETIWKPGRPEAGLEAYREYKEEYPAMYPRAAQYGLMPGEQPDVMAPGARSNWMLYTEERDSINDEYNSGIDGYLRDRPWDLAGAFDRFYDKRQADIAAAREMYPMPELEGDMPTLLHGMNPTEMWDAVVEEELYQWQATEPQSDDFAAPSGEVNWEAYNRAEAEWRRGLPELPTPVAGTYAGMDAETAYQTFEQRHHTPIQGMAYTYRDQVKNPTWEQYRLLVAQGVSKGDAYQATVATVGPMAATALIPAILQEYRGKEWTPESLGRELAGIYFPAMSEQRKGGEAAGGGGGYAATAYDPTLEARYSRGTRRRTYGGGGGGRWRARRTTQQYPRWRPPPFVRGGPFRF